jgi:hypothetical protein
MMKFGFHIRTRSGQKVDNIVIQALSKPDAEKRLRQMYQHCVILDCRERRPDQKADALDVEAVISMISREPLPLRPRI